MLAGERILVTGGAGFIGSSLVERVAPRNDVTILDDLSVGSLRNLEAVRGQVHLVKASVLDRRQVLRASKDCTIAFHLAALTSVRESFEQPHRYADVNVMGTANVLGAAAHAGVRRVVFASTCAAYGPSRAARLSEAMKPNPKSPYAMSKLAAEELCEAAARGTEMDVVRLRVFNVFGPRQSASSSYASVIARFAKAVAGGEPLVVYGSGNQTRDFIYVEDAAEALELAALATGVRGAVLNVGSGRATSVWQLVRILESIIGRKLPVRREPARPGDLLRAIADTTRARKVLGFRARTVLEEGLRRTLEEPKGTQGDEVPLSS